MTEPSRSTAPTPAVAARGAHRHDGGPADRGRPGPPGPRRLDASMALLNDLMERPTDPSYAEAAGRPHPDETAPQRLTRFGLELVVAFALGLVMLGAIVNLRGPESAVQSSRTVLTDRITERTDRAEALSQANEELSADLAQLQADALAGTDPELFAELARSELLSGAVGVSGPGLVIELSDAPPDADGQVDPERRVQDIDVQVVANGLWASGAEAIAVNGQRLTALSAIRSANIAILVNLVPLSSPYRIEAVGDVRSMQTAFARTAAADHLALLDSTYGIGVSTRAEDDLSLAGAGSRTLRYAAAPEDVASSASTDEEGTP